MRTRTPSCAPASSLAPDAERSPRRAFPSQASFVERPARFLVAFAAALVLALVAADASAAPKDAQAEKAYKSAMDEDYLDSKFDDAAKKIDKAIDACGSSGCSPKVKAKLFIAKGIVAGGGKHKTDEAKDAFVEALKLDSTAKPDPDYMTNDLKTAFDEATKLAKKAGGSGGSGGNEPSEGPMSHSVVEEQKVHTPIPLYVSFDEDTAKNVASVIVKYVRVSGGAAKELHLEKSGKGYKGNIPCTATNKTGTVKYWIVAKDGSGETIGTSGSEESPNQTAIKSELDGKAPSWPGFAPPEACAAGSDEGGGDEGGDKSSHRQCVDDSDCPSTEKCSSNECLLKPSGGGDDNGSQPTGPDTEKKRRHWITLAFVPDFDVISGDGICSKQGQADQHFACLRQPGTGGKADASVYTGTPTQGQGNNINGGLGIGQMRLMIGYDGVVYDNLSLGVRVGYAFNGTGAPANFIPAHVEARASYAFGSKAYTTAIARPWIMINGGFAQFDSPVDVQVVEDGEVCGADVPDDFKSKCAADYGKAGGKDGNTRIQTLTAVKQAGLGFIGLGGGVSFMPARMFAINLGLRFSATVPVFVPVLSPEAGFSLGF